jgi:hypothetical protein
MSSKLKRQPPIINRNRQADKNAKKLGEVRGQLNQRLEFLASNDPTYQRLMGRLDMLIVPESEDDVAPKEYPFVGENTEGDHSEEGN